MITPHTKRISVDALVVGMYIVGLDQSWLHSPFLWRRRRIGGHEDIARLKAYGIQQVTIDPTRGPDVTETPPMPTVLVPPSPPPVPGQELTDGTMPTVQPALREPVDTLPDLILARAVHTAATTAVQSLFEGARTGTPLQSAVAQDVVQSLLETVLSQPAALAGVLHMRQFDADLATHAINVCIFALMLGAAQALDEATLACLGMGALLHDIGQVHLPRNLLRKPGVYTASEQRLMQAHPRLGVTMLVQTPDITPETCRLVAEHHERLDGSGYPQGLRGAALSSLSQTVAIADSYETMLGDRAGRPPLLPTQALQELYQCGRLQQLDLHLVETMVRCLGVYPVGSLVALNTGECAMVIAANPAHALRPMIRLLGESQRGDGVPPVLIDLAAPDAAPSRTILQALDPATAGYDVAMLWQEGRRN